MNETTLTLQLRKTFSPSITIIKHTDVFQAGICDLSMSFADATSWWEVKYANPGLIQREVQKLKIYQFSFHARVRYVIFDAVRGGVQIVEPKHLSQREAYTFCDGFDFQKVAQEMLRIHRL